jgi:hypothetical protein
VDGSPPDPLTSDWACKSILLNCFGVWEKEPVFHPFSFGEHPFYFPYVFAQNSVGKENLAVKLRDIRSPGGI